MNNPIQQRIQLWLSDAFDDATHAEIKKLQKEDPQALEEAFCKHLEFGTGGMRALMGVGTNRLNRYTIQMATQGLANYLLQTVKQQELSIAIGYDTRHHSKEFAHVAASVLAGNGIHAYLFDAAHPTPLVSFACRFYDCQAAIMITASHNTAAYNGYKVYWSDGAQVVAPHDKGITNAINALSSPKNVKQIKDPGAFIHLIGEEVDAAYLSTVGKKQLYPSQNQSKGHTLKIVYTSLHGTGVPLLPKLLNNLGFTHLTLVEKQCLQDGDFPTVTSPNPEHLKTLEMGIGTLMEIEGDILIASDPDADRAALVIREEDGIRLLTGSQIAALCSAHILEALAKQNHLPVNGYLVKSFVTTPLMAAIAKSYNIPCFDVPTGFKYIAQMIREKTENVFIFGAEESYGYLLGDQTRDKDALIAAALFAEMALQAKEKGKTLYQQLLELFKKHGIYREKLLSITFGESQEGKSQMEKALHTLQNETPTHLLGTPIDSVDTSHPGVIGFHLADGSQLYVRPSGTEPLIKVYASTTCPYKESVPMQDHIEHCDTLCEGYLSVLKKALTTYT